MLRFSLRTLVAAVAAVALACGVLINANAWIASTAWSLVVLLLSFAGVAAVVRTPRGFWAGFAIVGWLYVAIVMGPFAGRLDGLLLTTTALNRAAAAMPQAKDAGQAQHTSVVYELALTGMAMQQVPAGSQLWPYPLSSLTIQGSRFVQAFVQTGQALWTLLLALLGRLAGTMIVRRNCKPNSDGLANTASLNGTATLVYPDISTTMILHAQAQHRRLPVRSPPAPPRSPPPE